MNFLVDKFKASIYERTRDGSTLMHIAAIYGHPDTAMALFDRGVSKQNTPSSDSLCRNVIFCRIVDISTKLFCFLNIYP